MCKGICTTPNRNIVSFNKLLTENTDEQLNDLMTNEYFKSKINGDLFSKIERAKSDNDTILLDSSNSSYKRILTELCIWNTYKWPNGSRIKVKFLNRNAILEPKIIRFAKEWEQHANIMFDFIEYGEADIRISLINDFSSWSCIGISCLDYINEEPTMNFGWFFNDTPDEEIKRVTLHEFGHALGCIHEHQHPDNNIPWDEQAIRRVYTVAMGWPEEKVQNNIINQFPTKELSNSKYDPDSIMHYFFPKEFTFSRIAFKENVELSETDKKFISAVYPK